MDVIDGPLLTPAEAAILAGLPEWRIIEFVISGDLPAVAVGDDHFGPIFVDGAHLARLEAA